MDVYVVSFEIKLRSDYPLDANGVTGLMAGVLDAFDVLGVEVDTLEAHGTGANVGLMLDLLIPDNGSELGAMSVGIHMLQEAFRKAGFELHGSPVSSSSRELQPA